MVAANVEKHRCIYENNDIIVEHQIISYGSGDREALMLVHQLKDGLMWRTESGALRYLEKDDPKPFSRRSFKSGRHEGHKDHIFKVAYPLLSNPMK